jgi:hypothetical protein
MDEHAHVVVAAMLMRYAVALASILILVPSVRAAAETRPTSGDPSVLSGRTLGNGEVVIAVDAGFPGVRATAVFAPSSRVNVGARGAFLYGSPYMGIGTGVGGAFEAPMRFLVFAHERIDLSVTLTPRLVLGRGRLVGQKGFFDDDFGLGAGAAAGARAGFRLGDRITLTTGLEAELAFITVTGEGSPGGKAIGVFTGVFGLEALLDSDIVLTLEATAGYGVAPDVLFDGHGVIRIFAGVAFLL